PGLLRQRPETNDLVVAGGKQTAAVGSKHGAAHLHHAFFVDKQLKARLNVPKADGAVGGAGNGAAAVGREGDVPDPAGVAFEAPNQFAGLHVPQTEDGVAGVAVASAARKDRLAVGREGHGVHPGLVSVEAAQLFAAVDVPKADAAIPASG